MLHHHFHVSSSSLWFQSDAFCFWFPWALCSDFLSELRFGLDVWEIELGSFYLDKNTCEQTTNWRTFWQRECSPRCHGILCSRCSKSDDIKNQMTSASFLANRSPAQLHQSPKQCLRWWHKPTLLTRYGVNTPQRYWNQVAFGVDCRNRSTVLTFVCACAYPNQHLRVVRA